MHLAVVWDDLSFVAFATTLENIPEQHEYVMRVKVKVVYKTNIPGSNEISLRCTRRGRSSPENSQLVFFVPLRIILVPRELGVQGEVLLGAKLGAALLARERMHAQMFLVDVIPHRRLP